MSKKTQPPAGEDVAAPTVRLMVVGLGEDEYAIPTDMVRAIDPYRPPRPVPGSASHVEGVVNLGGRLVPVMSLRARMGIHGDWSRADARTVIVSCERRAAGLVVDDVREVIDLDPRRYASLRRRADPADPFASTFRLDGHRVCLVDVSGLLAEERLAA